MPTKPRAINKFSLAVWPAVITAVGVMTAAIIANYDKISSMILTNTKPTQIEINQNNNKESKIINQSSSGNCSPNSNYVTESNFTCSK